MTKYIAFICGHNSGRSQMAQGAFNYLKKLSPKIDAEYEAVSWGTGIKEDGAINPTVIGPMKAIGVDLEDKTKHYPKTIDDQYIQERLGKIIRAYTMGCMDNVCELPGGMPITSQDVGDWDLEDPAKEETDVNAVRDKIVGKALELINELSKT